MFYNIKKLMYILLKVQEGEKDRTLSDGTTWDWGYSVHPWILYGTDELKFSDKLREKKVIMCV
jgi:hypothetical protein